MSKRNKILLTLAVIVCLVASLTVALVVVFAEEQEPIVRNVNAVYRVVDADCAISTSYKYANLDENNFTTSGLNEDANVLVFDNAGNKNIDEKTLKPTSDIVLTKENNSVIFEFKFTNNGENAFDATLLLKNEEKSNVVIRYSENGTRWTANNVKISVDGKTDETPVSASYFVKISLEDVDVDYTYSVDFTWTIIGQF